MTSKPKIAFYWCASCGGCDETIVDLAEDLLPLLEAVDVVLWPVAMDFKKRDIEALEDGAIAATFLNGAVRTSEQEEMAHLLRAKSRFLVAYGACAQLGGIPGLANQFSREEILRYAYEDAPTVENPGKARPEPATRTDGHALTLPVFRQGVRTLAQIVPVDYYLPGCPPTPRLTRAAIDLLLGANTAPAQADPTATGATALPPRGSVLAPDVALCDECPHKASKPATLSFTTFHRPHEVMIDPQTCLLAQAIVCMGPATRGGCGALCLAANMPCTGCFGPTSRVRDQGAKMLSCLSGSLTAKDPDEIAAALRGLPDPVGTFYRYALPASLLRRSWAPPTATPGPATRTRPDEDLAVRASPNVRPAANANPPGDRPTGGTSSPHSGQPSSSISS